MPQLPPISGLIKMLLIYSAPGIADIMNRVFFSSTGQPGTNALNTAAQTIANSWTTQMAPISSPTQLLNTVSLQDLSSPTAFNGIWVGNKAGTAGTPNVASPAVAMVIKNGVANRYRGGHSHVYIPGLQLGNMTQEEANTWQTTFANSVASAWSAFLGNAISALVTAGYSGVVSAVPHYYKGAARTWTHYGIPPHDWYKKTLTPVAPPVPVDTYTTVGANLVLASQRRRNHQSL